VLFLYGQHAVLDKNFFTGDSEPPRDTGIFEQLQQQCGQNPEKGRVVAPGLSLDNKHVSKGLFLVSGNLRERDIKLAYN
jgi:hypothetical protein